MTDKDDKKRDEVLKRLLKTPPKPKRPLKKGQADEGAPDREQDRPKQRD